MAMHESNTQLTMPRRLFPTQPDVQQYLGLPLEELVKLAQGRKLTRYTLKLATSVDSITVDAVGVYCASLDFYVPLDRPRLLSVATGEVPAVLRGFAGAGSDVSTTWTAYSVVGMESLDAAPRALSEARRELYSRAADQWEHLRRVTKAPLEFEEAEQDGWGLPSEIPRPSNRELS